MIARSRAPFRVELSGGGTDVPPYTLEHVGAILNFTIDKYATTTIREARETYISSIDYDLDLFLYDINGPPLIMIKTAVQEFLTKYGIEDPGMQIVVQSDAPPGSGIGSSSTVCVSVLGALHEYFNIPYRKHDIAVMAYKIERELCAMPGGSQDQFAAAFGGFNYLIFQGKVEDTEVYPLRLSPSLLKELETSFLLVDTGKSHNSGEIIEKQKEMYLKGGSEMLERYERAAGYARQMSSFLVKERPEQFFGLLSKAHQNKIRFCDLIETTAVRNVYDMAMATGAKACRILGAGGGGHMLIACDITFRKRIIDALVGLAIPVNFMFEQSGLHTWKI